jgi:uncharacterized membrane protein YidH (DUF202 family)
MTTSTSSDVDVPEEPQPAPPVSMAQFAPLPPPPPGFVASRWSGPAYGGGSAAWLSALIGGVATAIALPLTKPGIGWFLVGLVITLTVAYASRFGPRPDKQSERVIRIGWVVLTLALLSIGTFLNAYWLVYIGILGALGCASLALAGGHSVRAVLFAAVALPLSFFRSIPWLMRGANSWQRAREKQTTVSRTAFAVLITIVLVVIFTALFASADPAFGKIVSDVIPDFTFGTVRRAILYTILGGLLTAGAIFIVLAPPDLSGLERPATRRIGRVELLLPLGALALLFAGFVAVQFRFLFAGEPPEGSTFSKYAVQGFGQLVVVTLLTLLIIACASRWSPRETESDRTVLRSILGVLVLLSLVIVASAVYRMWLYMNELGWTRERLFFGSVEIFLGFVFVLVLLAGVQLRASWFPRAVIASFAVMLLAIAAFNPERYIAQQNIERFEALRDSPGYMRTFDLGYLQWLTSDAIDELVQMDEPFRSCALKKINDDLRTQPDQWYSWNLSRAHARDVLAKTAFNPDGCTEWFRIRENAGSR